MIGKTKNVRNKILFKIYIFGVSWERIFKRIIKILGDDPSLYLRLKNIFVSKIQNERYAKNKKEYTLSVSYSVCLTLCDPMECSRLGLSVLGILQAKILEWVAIPFSRESSQPRDQTWVSCITGRFFMI